MNNQFFGDEGDFYKYCLLRAMARRGLRIGVCWLRTQGYKSGGGETGYLNHAAKHRHKDAELFDFLRACVHGGGRRDIMFLEQKRARAVIPNAAFFKDAFGDARREEYFDNMLAAFRNTGADLLFADPDTGIFYRKTPARDMDSYIRWHEIEKMFNDDPSRSVMVLQWFRHPFWRNDGKPTETINYHNIICARLKEICGSDARVRMIRRRHFACYILARPRQAPAIAAATTEAVSVFGYESFNNEIPPLPQAA